MLNNTTLLRRPNWLNKKINISSCQKLSQLLSDLKLNTICQQAMCPNISECFSQRVATFLILGKTCTRNCRFCAVDSGIPQVPDPQEPARVAEAVKKLELRHVVVTSVTRDDLPDDGSGLFAATIKEIHKISKSTVVEVLVPDFKADVGAIREIVNAGPQIFAHNLETVPSLYQQVRSGASYRRSLEVLKIAKQLKPGIYTKSGLMVGLGESESEVLEALADLREIGCDFLSLGQYLSPSRKHFPVKEYINPRQFAFYKSAAQGLGFTHVESGPYVRSSYLACRYL